MFIVPCPSCGRCGCECGRLPYTVTLSLSDFSKRNRTEECALSISACFGSGAHAVVMQPGGCTNTPTCGCDGSGAGPITELLLIDGGSCYAVLGREEPEVTATVVSSSGSGAELEVTLTEGQDSCGLPVWSVASVDVIEKGSGYSGVPTIAFSAAGGSRETTKATAFVSQMEPREPTSLDVSSPSGTGAAFTVSTTKSGTSPDRWSISSVAVTQGGSDYIDGESLSVDDYDGLFVDDPAQLVLRTARAAPTLQAFPASGGVDAAITVTTSQTSSAPDLWSASAISVDSPGSGYTDGDLWTIYALDGVTVAGGEATATVDENGELISLTVTDGGQFYLATGVAESVEVIDGGSYYEGSDKIEGVTVSLGGEYYRENRDLPALVADVVVVPCGGGNGAIITASVEDDVDSDSFGQIKELKIENGGDDYLSWTWSSGCLDRLNGQSIVLRAQDPHELVTLEVQSCYGSGACVQVKTDIEPCGWDGSPTALPGVILTSGGTGYAKRGRIEPTLSLSATPGSGATFTPTFGSKKDDCGLDYWYIEAVAASGGSGYVDNSAVKVAVTNGVAQEAASLTLSASEGVPTDVTVRSAGKYYRESNSIAAYTPNVTVAVVQTPPSDGDGAAVSVTVNTDPLDSKFGQIVGATLTSAGSGYLLLGGPRFCEYEGPCQGRLDFSGKSVVGLLTGVFNESDPQPDCGNISSESTIRRGLVDGTVNVEAGGAWSSCADPDCGECPEDACGAEVAVTVSVCGEVINFTIPIGGGFYGENLILPAPPGGVDGYLNINAAAGCQSDDCGYVVAVLLCYACPRESEDDPIDNRGEAFLGCIEAQAEDGCPTGGVSMICLGELLDPPIQCDASVTAVLA